MFIKFTVGMMILALWLFLSIPEPNFIEPEPVVVPSHNSSPSLTAFKQ